MKHSQIIILFVKPPIPGKVKTRLAKDIGNDAACAIYLRLANHTIHEVQASGIPLALFFDGVNPAELPDNWRQAAGTCYSQQGDDLGERMANAFQQLFAEGVEQVILIGSDIPELDATYLNHAFDLLASNGLVIGPAIDGGYCLIGFNRNDFTASVFHNIPWSTANVLEETLKKADKAGLSYSLLQPLRDIDTIEDFLAAGPELLRGLL